MGKNYRHNWVNHSVGFVDPDDNTIHTNNIENKWSQLRKFVKRNLCENYINIYLNNFLFFYHLEEKDRYSILINIIKKNVTYFKSLYD